MKRCDMDESAAFGIIAKDTPRTLPSLKVVWLRTSTPVAESPSQNLPLPPSPEGREQQDVVGRQYSFTNKRNKKTKRTFVPEGDNEMCGILDVMG